MKNFYIENFALRLVFCIVGMYAIWIGIQFVMDTVIFHDPFRLDIIDYIVPAILGVIEAFAWKPKS